MAWKLADLFVEITGRPQALFATLVAVKGALLGTAAQFKGIGLGIGALLAGGIAGVGIVYGLKKSFQAATDFNEMMNKVRETFGQSADLIIHDAEEMARKFGVPKTQFLDTAASFGLIAEGSGLAEKEAAKLATGLTKLAADATSFFHVPLEETLGAIQSGLVGMERPLRRFGVLISEQAVEAEAARLGMHKLGKELTDGQKIQARASLITKGFATATGDLERTSGSAANRLRAIWGRLGGVFEKVGETLRPATDALLGTVNTFLTNLGGFFERNSEAIKTWVANAQEDFAAFASSEGVQGILQTVGAAFEWFGATAMNVFENVGFVMRNFDGIVRIVGIQVYEKILNIGEIFQWLMGVAGQLGEWLGSQWLNILSDVFTAAGQVVWNFATNVQNLFAALYEFIRSGKFEFNWTPLLEGFKAVTAQLPDIIAPKLTDMRDQIDEALKDIGVKELERLEQRAKRIAPAIAPGRGKPLPGGADTAGTKRELFVSLEEFSKKLQEGAVGKGNAAEQTAKGVGQLVGLQQASNDLQERALSKKDVAVAAGPA